MITEKLSLLDKAIYYFSPQTMLLRKRARYQHELFLARKYDAASNSRRTDGWVSPTTSSQAEINPALSIIRQRSRDLVRNNAYAERAVRAIAANVVGSGIVPQAKSRLSSQAKKLDQLWEKWAGSSLCDYDNHHTFYGLQSLIMRTVVESGECLIRKCRCGFENDAILPLQLQVLEPDFIDSHKNTVDYSFRNKYEKNESIKNKTTNLNSENLNRNNRIIQGIEFDKQGKRVAYWLFDEHPGNALNHFKRFESQRVPAEDIIHIYRMDRPGQIRGMPWAAPIMIKLKDLDDYDQAELVRHKIAACFAGFIRDIDGMESPHQSSLISDKFEPGILEILPPGRDISFSNPPQVQGYSDYVNAHLRSIAVGFGIPYEVLTSDYSQVNFSSSRMGWLEFQRNIDHWQWQLLIPNLCDPVWEWFVDAARMVGYVDEVCKASWTPPRREMIDPAKEVNALRDQVRCGFMTLSEAIRLLGYDPKEQLTEWAQDAKKLDELKLLLDCDPRHLTQNGMMQSTSTLNLSASKKIK